MGLSRGVAVAVAATGIVATGAGALWWAVAGAGQSTGLAQYAAVAAGASLFGGFVLWHRPGNPYGAMHLALGLLFGTVVLAAVALGATADLPPWVARLALAWSWLALPLLLPLWVMVIATFPTGRFHRRWPRILTVIVGSVMAVLAVAAYLSFPTGESLPLIAVQPDVGLSGPLAAGSLEGAHRALASAGSVLGTTAPLLALVALADRYRRAGLVERQQITWLLAGAAVSVLLQAIPVEAIEGPGLRAVLEVVVVLAVPLPLLAAAVAIFRHGLWEIDVVVTHGVVYVLLSTLLATVFLVGAVAVGVGVGGPDQRVVVALVLAVLVSHLAQPLRARLVSAVGRLLFGEGPQGLLALSGQAAGTGTTDARGLGERVVAVTRSALGAPWARVWLLLPGTGGDVRQLRPVAESGHPAGPPRLLSHESVAALARLSGAQPAGALPPATADAVGPGVAGGDDLVAPLVAEGDLLGLLVCGARRADPYTDDDRALLTVLSRDAAMGLRNVRLEEELRARLVEIETQADELRRSRQRLVRAQDEERRRIERDLHDGAQQQLVLLAAALRRAARGADADGLERLADQAEEAVFTLQELARGIYPGVLVDQGLQAALQTQTARLPADVRLEIGPGLHGRRLPQDVEAVLYYVALEATTNAVKHAPQAQVTVALHVDDSTRLAVLEVHDDGPGFRPGTPSGAGLQNMSDRVAAAGGAFSVESAPGAGTWVRAEVPLPATVTPLRDAAGSP